MLGKYAIPVIASILILSTFAAGSFFEDAEAKKGDNNGNKGCENANPNSKACEKNPNTEPPDDTEPPIITASTAPPPNANGWNNSDVVVSFECEDNEGGSGVATLTDPITVTTEGANQQFTGTCTDNAGNSATVTVTVNLDKTAPALAISPTDGETVTTTTPELIADFSDSLAGIISFQALLDAVDISFQFSIGATQATATSSALSEGPHTFSVTVTDQAGNPSTVFAAFFVDTTP